MDSNLLKEYGVRTDYTCVDSNIVYPFDSSGKTGYEFEGYMDESDVPFGAYAQTLESKYTPKRIANKYAIPLFRVKHMHTQKTFFAYQHDKKIWLISKKEDTKTYNE
jgi:hypothetical protein